MNMFHQDKYSILFAGALLIIIMQNFVESAPNSDYNVRVRRQQSYNVQDGNNFIDSIFQIPISTLTAVGSLIKNTRPIVMRARERIQQQYEQYQNQQNQNQQSSQSRPVRGSNYYNSYNKRTNKKRNSNNYYQVQGRDFSNY